LHIDSSILGANSVSRAISAAVVARLTAAHPGLEVQYRDLAATPLTHLSGAYLGGQGEDVAEGGAVLAEFLAADIVVVGSPMYNFTLPTKLKAWIDRWLVAGKTFHYTANGPEGLAGGKRVILALSRGGVYAPGTPNAAADHQETYLRLVFAFVGIPSVEVVCAEGVAMGPEARAKALEAALASASALPA
jgi:FMN-dependent NADH-azoreductase